MRDLLQAILFRFWIFLAVMIWLAAMAPAVNAQPRNDRPEWNQADHYPRWCRDWDQRAYWREMRNCGRDVQCRRYTERKAQRCGLR